MFQACARRRLMHFPNEQAENIRSMAAKALSLALWRHSLISLMVMDGMAHEKLNGVSDGSATLSGVKNKIYIVPIKRENEIICKRIIMKEKKKEKLLKYQYQQTWRGKYGMAAPRQNNGARCDINRLVSAHSLSLFCRQQQ